MKLNNRRMIFVGLAFFLICIFWQAYDTIIPKILTDKFGMSQASSGIIMALDNILALFMLPLFGALSDKCNSKLGKRTPYIIVGTVIAAFAFVTLSFADNMQLTNIKDVSEIDSVAALEVLYDNDYEKPLMTPDGEEYVIQEKFTREEFSAIRTEADGKTNPEYTDYVVPARQYYAWQKTCETPGTLIFFVAILLIVLISMAIFRSPAVALMPDVTIKPLRSKANAIINLMGAAGGIIVLGLGIAFKTGSIANSLMSYTVFFIIIASAMLISLVVFLLKVKEPRFAEEMRIKSAEYNIDENEKDENGEKRKLSKGELVSLILILASVMLWYMGYNAVTSKYSVYAGKVLNLDYNLTLMVANAAAIVSYIPVGMIASKVGRKKTILAGVLMLAVSFGMAMFMRENSSALLLNIFFALAGIGWATINVNSFPMVVELSHGGDIGKYTGYYYTASMAAQTLTPYLSGLFLDKLGMTTLFPYATVFVVLSFVTMLFVRHGDNKPQAPKEKLEMLGGDD